MAPLPKGWVRLASGKTVVGVPVALHHRQRGMERHPEDEIGQLAEATAHIAADPAQNSTIPSL